MAYDRNTKTKGNGAELEVMCFFNRHRFIASIPFGDNAPYDLVVESPKGKLYRVQVRWASWAGNSLKINLRRSSQGSNSPLDLTRIDAFVAWDGCEAIVVPVEKLKHCRAGFTVRRGLPKNGQKSGVNDVHDYLGATHLLP